jgi:hypothetical protein
MYGYEARRIQARGNNGKKPPRTAGMRAKTGLPLQPMRQPSIWYRLFGMRR